MTRRPARPGGIGRPVSVCLVGAGRAGAPAGSAPGQLGQRRSGRRQLGRRRPGKTSGVTEKRVPPILIKSRRRGPRFGAVFVRALAGLASGQDLATLDLSARCNVSFIVAPVRICIMIAPAPLRGTEKGATPDDSAR